MSAVETCLSFGLPKENINDVPADFLESWQVWEPPKCSGESNFFIVKNYLTHYNYEKLEAATENYCRAPYFMGKGPYGNLFRSVLKLKYDDAPPAATPVLIEQLDPLYTRVDKTWRNEVKYLSHALSKKIYLLNLIGYAYKEQCKALLVYEPIPGDTLADHISGISKVAVKSNFDWYAREDIAYCVANALVFLHRSNPPCIWRDPSTATVFLDECLNPKIFNIGLTADNAFGGNSLRSTPKLLDPRNSAVAPEYFETGNITTSCNVYSFGVFLLQIVSGRQIIDENRPVEERNIVDWARPLLSEGKILDIVDSQIYRKWEIEPRARVLCLLAALCIKRNPEERPSMGRICKVLNAQVYGGYAEIRPKKRDSSVVYFLDKLVDDCVGLATYIKSLGS